MQIVWIQFNFKLIPRKKLMSIMWEMLSEAVSIKHFIIILRCNKHTKNIKYQAQINLEQFELIFHNEKCTGLLHGSFGFQFYPSTGPTGGENENTFWLDTTSTGRVIHMYITRRLWSFLYLPWEVIMNNQYSTAIISHEINLHNSRTNFHMPGVVNTVKWIWEDDRYKELIHKLLGSP